VSLVQLVGGEVKFSIELNGWPFGKGTFIEVQFKIMIPPLRAVRPKQDGVGRGNQLRFSLLGDAAAYFPTQVNILPIGINIHIVLH